MKSVAQSYSFTTYAPLTLPFKDSADGMRQSHTSKGYQTDLFFISRPSRAKVRHTEEWHWLQYRIELIQPDRRRPRSECKECKCSCPVRQYPFVAPVQIASDEQCAFSYSTRTNIESRSCQESQAGWILGTSRYPVQSHIFAPGEGCEISRTQRIKAIVAIVLCDMTGCICNIPF